MSININQLVDKLSAGLNRRQKEIFEKRFGIRDGKEMTLESIGKIFGITRERVRQIEAGILKEMEKLTKQGILNNFFDKVESYLKTIGGIRKENLLLKDICHILGESVSSALDNKLKLLLSLSKSFKYIPDGEEFYAYWYSDNNGNKKAVELVNKLEKYMKSKKQEILSHRDFNKIFKEAIKPQNIKDAIALNYISISKKFHINQFGDLGLAHWPEVNPHTVRDWAHLVLHKERKPLHFTEISKAIDRVCNNKKLTNFQTVHNELIKDQRFILVGRGLYALKDHGYMPGTTLDVMAKLLKKHGPMKSRDLLELVLKERLLKRNTIFVNLQNKKYFKRTDDGRYTVNIV